MYQVKVTGTWTALNHPVSYPGDGPDGPNAHFSPVVAATSGYDDAFWKLGGMATSGVEAVAEMGAAPALIDELTTGSMKDAYLDVKHAPLEGLYFPWMTELMEPIKADTMHDHLGLATMIAPSPDWFTGASMIALCDYATGEWKEMVEYDAMAYDAGTEMGGTFSTTNDPEDPHKAISMVMCMPDAFCAVGEDIKPVATIKVTKM